MRPAAAVSVLLGTCLWVSAGGAAATVALSQPWYYTEVIIFQRPGVLEHAGAESLVRHRGARLPQTLRLLLDDPYTRQQPIDPATRLCLTYPILTLLPAGTRWADEIDGEAGAALTGRPPPSIEPHLAPDPKLDALRRLRAFEDALEAQSYRWLEPESFLLRSHADRLRRSGHQVLLHGRWLQAAPPREAPEALLVRAGPQYGDVHALEGTLDVTLARFLHFRAHLTYREPLLGRAPVDWAFEPREDAGSAVAVPLRALSGEELAPPGYLLLDESRRMRSTELHYLDHPKLGILVRIDPVAVPAALSAALDALEESR